MSDDPKQPEEVPEYEIEGKKRFKWFRFIALMLVIYILSVGPVVYLSVSKDDKRIPETVKDIYYPAMIITGVFGLDDLLWDYTTWWYDLARE